MLRALVGQRTVKVSFEEGDITCLALASLLGRGEGLTRRRDAGRRRLEEKRGKWHGMGRHGR